MRLGILWTSKHLQIPVWILSNLRFVSSYIPRKCSATNRIIKANDHASVQISIGKVDDNGRYTGENQVYALCGFVRARGEGDDSLNRLAQRDGLLKNVWGGQRWSHFLRRLGWHWRIGLCIMVRDMMIPSIPNVSWQESLIDLLARK